MQDFLFVKDGSDYYRIFFSDILYVEAENKYARLITAKRKYLILQTLNTIEELLPKNLFCRIHRSYIISLIRTISFNASTVNIEDKILPIGKQYKGILPTRVLVFNGNHEKPVFGKQIFHVTKNNGQEIL